MGIKTVIIPDGNKREIDDLPQVLKDEISFVPVKSVDEVFNLVLEGGEGYILPSEEKTKTPRKKRMPKSVPPIPHDDANPAVRC